MKNKIAIASAFLAAASFSNAEIVINDFLSFEGFVDMSYSTVNGELDHDNESNNSFQVDQVEIDWLFDFDPVTARIDIQYEGSNSEFSDSDYRAGRGGRGDGDDDGNVFIEQAFVTYHFEGNYEGATVSAGRYASMLGFEAFEPTGLYQYSFAYDMQNPGFDDDNAIGDFSVIPNYAQGVKFTYDTENTFFGLSIQDEAFDYDSGRLGGDDDNNSSWAIEAAGAYEMDNGVTLFLGGAYEFGDGNQEYSDRNGNAGDTYVINTYVTYETGLWLFAAEATYGYSKGARFSLNTNEEEVLEGLIMANYAYSDVASVTGRLSYVDDQDQSSGGKEEFEAVKYTLAHNYAFTDNLLLVTEVSYVDGTATDDTNDDSDYDSLLGAVELLFSF